MTINGNTKISHFKVCFCLKTNFFEYSNKWSIFSFYFTKKLKNVCTECDKNYVPIKKKREFSSQLNSKNLISDHNTLDPVLTNMVSEKVETSKNIFKSRVKCPKKGWNAMDFNYIFPLLHFSYNDFKASMSQFWVFHSFLKSFITNSILRVFQGKNFLSQVGVGPWFLLCIYVGSINMNIMKFC